GAGSDAPAQARHVQDHAVGVDGRTGRGGGGDAVHVLVVGGHGDRVLGDLQGHRVDREHARLGGVRLGVEAEPADHETGEEHTVGDVNVHDPLVADAGAGVGGIVEQPRPLGVTHQVDGALVFLGGGGQPDPAQGVIG